MRRTARRTVRHGMLVGDQNAREEPSASSVDQQIVENMQLGMFVFHLEEEDDDHSLRLVRANSSGLRLTQLPIERALGQRVSDLFPGLDEVGLLAAYAQVARTGMPIRPMRTDYDDRRMKQGTWLIHAFSLPGRCVCVTFDNITHLVEAEHDAQRQVQRLAALRSIDLAILGSLDVRLTLQVVLDQATSHLRVDAGTVLLYGEDGHSLEIASSRGFRIPPTRETRLGHGAGLPGRVVHSRNLVQVPDLSAVDGLIRSETFQRESFVSYCGAPLIAKGKVLGVLELFHRGSLQTSADWQEFLEALAGQAAIALDNAVLLEHLQRTNAELQQAYEITLEGWTSALELRDFETKGHTRRVTDMTVALAHEMGVRGDALAHIRRGALLHDIGKIGVPDHILRKPGPLTDDEWTEMRKHTEHAYDLLAPIAFLQGALDIPRYHHERWDGKGYPFGLQATTIPLAARIFSVVDAWDAMRSNRPYRDALSEEEALKRIREGAGEQFDQQVVERFIDSRLYQMTDLQALSAALRNSMPTPDVESSSPSAAERETPSQQDRAKARK